MSPRSYAATLAATVWFCILVAIWLLIFIIRMPPLLVMAVMLPWAALQILAGVQGYRGWRKGYDLGRQC
jgi:hypothetical protein